MSRTAKRRLLVAWKLRKPRTGPDELVVGTVDGKPMQERNLRRTLAAAKEKAKLDGTEERLSWHSLRHSLASLLATDLELPTTTLARLTGHADAGFTLKVYARDRRDDGAVVEDVLAERSGRRWEPDRLQDRHGVGHLAARWSSIERRWPP